MNRSLPHVVRQAQLLARKDPELKAFLKESMRALSSIPDEEEKIQWLRSEVDRLLQEDTNNTQCQKGCHFCCYHPIALSSLEMKSIARERPSYDQERLITQRKSFQEGTNISYEQQACIFLNSHEGVCSIYQKRPLICRLTHVASAPENCHWENKNTPIEHLPVTKAALLVGAFYMIYPEIDLIPIQFKEESSAFQR